MDNNKPIVSICMVTYNHEKYIAKALDSILMQQCNFKYDVLIGDDVSTDSTRSIIKRYAEEHPEIFIPIFHEKNLGYQGQVNFTRVLEACKGKYIAVLEGDDYWSDPNKLQMQFDFMEANPEYVMCFTEVDMVDENSKLIENDVYRKLKDDTLTIQNVIISYKNLMPTATLFFRNQLPHPLPDFFTKAQNGDLALQLIVAHFGKIKYIPKKTACYRRHSGGITKTKEHMDAYHSALAQLYKDMNAYYKPLYNNWFRERLLHLSKIRLIDDASGKQGLKKLRHYFDRLPDYLTYSDKINIKELFYYHLVLFFPSVLKKIKSPSVDNNE